MRQWGNQRYADTHRLTNITMHQTCLHVEEARVTVKCLEIVNVYVCLADTVSYPLLHMQTRTPRSNVQNAGKYEVTSIPSARMAECHMDSRGQHAVTQVSLLYISSIVYAATC